ncbi:hypothetical protein BU15DRAFT_67340 [Melanogaster broomeanus]|nr:hypothetical protein BU15DRAFT_67340 [Melanogaster broomeanus]
MGLSSILSSMGRLSPWRKKSVVDAEPSETAGSPTTPTTAASLATAGSSTGTESSTNTESVQNSEPSLTVVVFGHTGAGTSSLVNLIVGNSVSVVGRARDCATTTMNATRHSASFGGRNLQVYDMPGYDALDVRNRDKIFPPSPDLVIACTQHDVRKAMSVANHVKRFLLNPPSPTYHNVPVVLVSSLQDQDAVQGNRWAIMDGVNFEDAPREIAQEVVQQTCVDSDATRSQLCDLILLRARSFPITSTDARR